MNALESQLDYLPRQRDSPSPAARLEVAPGVRWARMALPFALNHINVWLLRDRVADEAASRRARAGASSTAASTTRRRARPGKQLFATALDGLPVLRVIVTHMHPDHIGSAHWLCERWNARLWISATDFNIARMASSAQRRLRRAALGRLHGAARHGRRPGRRRAGRARAPTTTAAWCPPCRRRTGACSTAARRASAPARRAPSGRATSATATRPSTWRCTAPRAAC